MKLYGSPYSPYARKVLALARETGLTAGLTLITTSPRSPAFGRINPLQRIPALELDDGTVLFDSPVICEYLDTLHAGPRMLPASGEARRRAALLQALGDGIMDAALIRRHDSLRPPEQQAPEHSAHLAHTIGQTAAWLDARVPMLAETSLGTLAVASALAYLDLRFADEDWRGGRPRLAGWYEGFSARPAMAETGPEVWPPA